MYFELWRLQVGREWFGFAFTQSCYQASAINATRWP